MASVKIKIDRLKKTQAKIKKLPSAIDVELRKQTISAANEVVAKALKAIDEPKTGKVYSRKYANGGTLRWQASAPGEAPAKKSGRNRKLIRSKKYNRADQPGAKLLAPNIYRFLEEGLRRGNIAPRPLFGPILAAYKSEFKDNLDDAVRRVLGVTIRK